MLHQVHEWKADQRPIIFAGGKRSAKQFACRFSKIPGRPLSFMRQRSC